MNNLYSVCMYRDSLFLSSQVPISFSHSAAAVHSFKQCPPRGPFQESRSSVAVVTIWSRILDLVQIWTKLGPRNQFKLQNFWKFSVATAAVGP